MTGGVWGAVLGAVIGYLLGWVIKRRGRNLQARFPARIVFT